jgi:hypothetical protein
MARTLPRKGFPDRPVQLASVISKATPGFPEDLAKAAYNAGLKDAMWALGEYTKKGTPVPEAMLDRIRQLERIQT